MSALLEFDVVILGAGAAGMMAAVAAGEAALDDKGHSRVKMAVLEKNPQPGIKVLVCGGGRCNLTNAGDIPFLVEQFGRNGRFLTPALRHMDNNALRDWFQGQGVPTHEEHDGKIYPDSNQARSVVDALVRRIRELGVTVLAGNGAAANAVEKTDAGFAVTTVDGRVLNARILLIAVGGRSYVRMGTTGDGYGFAQSLGHSVVSTRPAIVPLLVKEAWVKGLQGLAVEGVEVKVEVPGPLPRLATGKPTPSVNDLLFTHFGLSGPAVLNPSEIVAELLEKFPTVTLRIDFLRRYGRDELQALIKSWQQTEGRRLVRTMAASLLPQRLAETFCVLSNVGPEQTCANLTAGQIHAFVECIKSCRFTAYDTRGFKEAMVTAGGVKLDEVDPKTMASKKVPGLYLAGEVLDLTGPSGGYNLQLAFSTGHLAGTSIARALTTS